MTPRTIRQTSAHELNALTTLSAYNDLLLEFMAVVENKVSDDRLSELGAILDANRAEYQRMARQWLKAPFREYDAI